MSSTRMCNEENLVNCVRTLSLIESRHYLNEGNKIAETYLTDELKKIGYIVEVDSFQHEGGCYNNIIARLNNGGDKNYIVCAHYDSISKDEKAPGADDNASGVAAVLELARLLKVSDLKLNMEFVLFNLEEAGGIGSKHLAGRYKEMGIKLEGVINLDTIGTWEGDLSESYPVTYVTNEDSEAFMNTIIENSNLNLCKCKDMWTDDHGSFWKVGYKAIELTEIGVTPYMHTGEDTYEKLNYKNIAKIVNGLEGYFKKNI
ncbi:MAG: M20/M25/M40 family metallo-hydrolase [Clostridium sp.]